MIPLPVPERVRWLEGDDGGWWYVWLCVEAPSGRRSIHLVTAPGWEQPALFDTDGPCPVCRRPAAQKVWQVQAP